MSIQILPARLANQIAAGEVVERPASVVKELVENSLDAGATKIAIDIEKGGAKCIRIADNGHGIAKDELTLALSRHATSKIKDLTDLEAIASLGFRGEALASISSVARLTLTSKPAEQGNAWQAFAQGRDMEVTVQPAAHPNGTTIEVNDLFFNTPARRKFLRTEKTEFSHIDEVVRRIALARFDVSISLSHNGKMVRQYRAIKDSSQYGKRVAQVCGQKFIEQAITVDCQHDGLHLWGWITHPEYHRSQNDLCYSYVNGRMMRDKLINHGIRQAFSDWIPNDSYPAFVLFLTLDHKEVDVNVHPAKHEVRFHQGRYVHDFIYSVCYQALKQALELNVEQEQHSQALVGNDLPQPELSPNVGSVNYVERDYTDRSYVQPLKAASQVNDSGSTRTGGYNQTNNHGDMRQAAASYQALMTPVANQTQADSQSEIKTAVTANQLSDNQPQLLQVIDEGYGLVMMDSKLKLVKLAAIATAVNTQLIEQRWQQGLTSQPLLLPVVISVSSDAVNWLNQYTHLTEQAGIHIQIQTGNKIQIRQFPAILREQDVALSVETLLAKMVTLPAENDNLPVIKQVLAELMLPKCYSFVSAKQLWLQAETVLNDQLNRLCDLNSVDIDLTSAISQLQ